jgi:hypothetical protein
VTSDVYVRLNRVLLLLLFSIYCSLLSNTQDNLDEHRTNAIQYEKSFANEYFSFLFRFAFSHLVH